ncbi:unnamed protein product [Urochloa humidicola]
MARMAQHQRLPSAVTTPTSSASPTAKGLGSSSASRTARSISSATNQALVGGVAKLPSLNLSKYETSTAAGKLWDHTQKALDDDDEDDATINAGLTLKEAVATLCVVLCEAARFTPIYDVINEGWDLYNVSITLDEVEYIKNWGDLSTQLLKWKDNKYTGDDELFKKFWDMGIHNGEEALDAVQLVKLITRSSSLLAWLKYFWGLLVKKLQLQKEDTAAVNPL